MVDGVLLPKLPEELLAEKRFNTVPYIVGINKQEFGWVLPTVSVRWVLPSMWMGPCNPSIVSVKVQSFSRAAGLAPSLA